MLFFDTAQISAAKALQQRSASAIDGLEEAVRACAVPEATA